MFAILYLIVSMTDDVTGDELLNNVLTIRNQFCELYRSVLKVSIVINVLNFEILLCSRFYSIIILKVFVIINLNVMQLINVFGENVMYAD